MGRGQLLWAIRRAGILHDSLRTPSGFPKTCGQTLVVRTTPSSRRNVATAASGSQQSIDGLNQKQQQQHDQPTPSTSPQQKPAQKQRLSVGMCRNTRGEPFLTNVPLSFIGLDSRSETFTAASFTNTWDSLCSHRVFTSEDLYPRYGPSRCNESTSIAAQAEAGGVSLEARLRVAKLGRRRRGLSAKGACGVASSSGSSSSEAGGGDGDGDGARCGAPGRSGSGAAASKEWGSWTSSSSSSSASSRCSHGAAEISGHGRRGRPASSSSSSATNDEFEFSMAAVDKASSVGEAIEAAMKAAASLLTDFAKDMEAYHEKRPNPGPSHHAFEHGLDVYKRPGRGRVWFDAGGQGNGSKAGTGSLTGGWELGWKVDPLVQLQDQELAEAASSASAAGSSSSSGRSSDLARIRHLGKAHRAFASGFNADLRQILAQRLENRRKRDEDSDEDADGDGSGVDVHVHVIRDPLTPAVPAAGAAGSDGVLRALGGSGAGGGSSREFAFGSGSDRYGGTDDDGDDHADDDHHDSGFGSDGDEGFRVIDDESDAGSDDEGGMRLMSPGRFPDHPFTCRGLVFGYWARAPYG